MKKIVLIFTLVIIGTLSAYSAASVKESKRLFTANPFVFRTIIEFGDFYSGDDIICVFGDSSTGEVTSVTFGGWGGVELYSFEPAYVWRFHVDTPWNVYLNYKKTSTSPTLNYEGVLLFM